MLKRIFILILALCCAFSFICQPVSAASTGVVLTAAMIGMAVAGAFGLTYASNAGYEAFGNNLHDAVISTGSAGSEWWNRSLAGNIVLTGLDSALKAAVWGCAKKAANMYVESESGSFTTEFTLSSYSLTASGAISGSGDFRGRSFSFTHSFDVPIYCIEFAYCDSTSSSYPYHGCFGYIFVSSEQFYCGSKAAKKSDNVYIYSPESSKWLDDIRLRKNCMIFSSYDDFDSYRKSLVVMSSGVSSAGGATAAYPSYGYDGVDLPNIDLTQPGLIGADGNSTVADLIAQLQSGAITWEDYIGTVAPGQTATITITDESGAAVTYTLTNTGVGTRVEPGTDVTEGTEPVVVPAPGELTGTLADTDAKSFLGSLAETIAKPFADVIEKVQAIPAAISEALATTFKPVADLGHFALDLSKYFPFCIPFDLYDFFMCLNAAPEAPVIDWEIPLPGGKTYPMKIDLSPFDPVAQLLRRLELLLFCVGLAFKTRDLIKG